MVLLDKILVLLAIAALLMDIIVLIFEKIIPLSCITPLGLEVIAIACIKYSFQQIFYVIYVRIVGCLTVRQSGQ